MKYQVKLIGVNEQTYVFEVEGVIVVIELETLPVTVEEATQILEREGVPA